jgi:nucleotide-binding universal stress UspA family protein
MCRAPLCGRLGWMTRTSKIIVGVDGSDRSLDAVAFATQLAKHGAATIVLVGAFRGAEAMLAQVADTVLGSVETRAVEDPSPARALHRLAHDEDAALIVIGSSHRSAEQVLTGSTAGRVVHHSPCAVAVVPTGHQRCAGGAIGRIGCAFDASPEAEAALASAVDAAQGLHAELEVIRALDHAAALGESAAAQLRGAVARAAERVRARVVIEVGEPARVLTERSNVVDLLFVGSRGYGPRRTLLLGSVTQQLLTQAACPVIVLPRGTEPLLATLFSPVRHLRVA